MKYLRPSLILLVVALLAYGLLMPQLGFYWDDLPMTWIRYQMGPEAQTDYFSNNRPVWGVLHRITTSMIPQVPLYWQIFALFWRWLGAVVVFAILTKLLKDKPRSVLGVALLFLVYPGFNQHWSAYLYSHFYIVLFFFLISLLCMLLAMEDSKRFWVWTAAGMLFSALNLWMMEYFYVLELARVGVILTAVRNEPLALRERVIRTLKLWMPYLVVFVLAVLSRLFIFNNQIYGMGLTEKLKSAPMETLMNLGQTILFTLRLVLKDAWLQMLELPDAAFVDSALTSYYLVIAAAILLAAAGFLLVPRDAIQTIRKSSMDAIWLIGLGALAVFLAGWPFWLIGFPPSLEWPASRFTLPFAFGVSLVFGGLIGLLPWERARIVLLVALVSLAVGKQYLNSRNYQQDWATQKELFWQMTWRAPGLKPDTVVLLNEGALDYYADNSLGAVLNWIYAPDNHTRHVEYVLFYPKTRLKNVLPKLETGIPIEYDYLAAQFKGNTSQTLAMYYQPPGCLRILDNDIERVNRMIPETSLLRFAARISSPELILNEPRARMPEVYGPEPEHDFCYYFEKADLSRQFKDWESVVKYAETALSLEHRYDPAEQLVFIEGYAHVGEWGRAVEISERANEFSAESVGPMLCRLWKRIGTETADSDALTGQAGSKRSAALDKIRSIIACDL
jgi:hypothetical protein